MAKKVRFAILALVLSVALVLPMAAPVGATVAFLAIDIEKTTNNEDADTPTGPMIVVGAPVLWEYIVTNTGNVPLTDVVVEDDILGIIGTISLAAGESATLTATGTALAGIQAGDGKREKGWHHEAADEYQHQSEDEYHATLATVEPQSRFLQAGHL